MSVKEYALKLKSLTQYALELVSRMRVRIRKFAFGLSHYLILQNKATLLNKDMNSSKLVMYI